MHVGIASPEQLSWLFSEATAALCFAMTNLSLIPKEMMAWGLPVVELDRPSARSIFGDPRPVELSEFDPDAVADHLKWLVGDRALWEQRSRDGLAWVEDGTWDPAAGAGRRRDPPRARERDSAPAAFVERRG